jgi:perosamine synthetase
VKEPCNAKSNYWLNAVLLDRDQASRRDAVLAHLNGNGLMARPAWTLMHELPMYRECPRASLPQAEDLAARLINIPSSSFL